MKSYSYTLGKSHAFNVFQIIKSTPSKGGAQGSYNIPKEMFDELCKDKILIFDKKNEQGEDYRLNDNINFVLSDDVISLIGEEYREIDNKFFIRVAESNGKPQLFKKAYKDKNSDKYMWFLELYNKNGVGNTIYFNFDENKQVLSIDLKVYYEEKVIQNNKVTEINDVDIEILENENGKSKLNHIAFNKIYYGVPGCGKSYTVDQEIREVYPNEKDYKNNVFRTTFFLDYTNSDFIGQLCPYTDEVGNVSYKPNFGPFSKALMRANETDEMVYLVIEEINRGNAAAIFGDLFQLLDRLDDTKVKARGGQHSVGESEYPITNTFIEDYLHIRIGDVKIPSNLSIYATMNTSDQNVFPLDTAFKRRWDLVRVESDWDSKRVKFMNKYIPFSEYTWYEFAKAINEEMINKSEDGMILEDKQLGPFFATDDMFVDKEKRFENTPENKVALDKFINNVMDYLWSDVTKFDHSEWFISHKSFKSVSDAIRNYGLNSRGSNNLGLKIFEIIREYQNDDAQEKE